MEAGVGTLTRLAESTLDLALLVAEPTAKSLEVARRAAEILAERKIGPILVVANRVRDPADVELVQSVLGETELVAIPEDPTVLRADRDGLSPIDSAPDGPAVRALADLAHRLVKSAG